MLPIIKYIVMYLDIIFAFHAEPRYSDIGHIVTLVKLFCNDLLEKYTVGKRHDIVYATVMARYYQYYAKKGCFTVYQFAKNYIYHKVRMYELIKDLGAIGDVIECLVRCAFIGNVNLLKCAYFHSAGFENEDIVSKKGIFECGINGKSFMQARPNNIMYGKFTSIVYGVINDFDVGVIMDYISNDNLQGAINYVADSMYVWENKQDFVRDINMISRGKGIVYKHNAGYAQVIYNPSKHNAFLENVRAQTLREYLNK